MNLIKEYTNKKIQVITNSGNVYCGILIGYDNPLNIVLKDTQQRIFSTDGTTIKECGLMVIKGDDVMLIGKVNEKKDSNIDWPCVISEPFHKAYI